MTKVNSPLETDIFNYHTPEFFINMKSIPDKASKERKSFVLEEKRKCKEGINVGGIRIPGSLYFHLNYYHLQRDATEKELLAGSDKKIISLPNLRDNEWIVFNDYDSLTRDPKIYTLCGARQLIKTEFECSVTLRELSIFKNTEALGIFQADEDKDTFVKKIRIAIDSGESFIIVPNIDKNWEKKEIRFGYMKQDSSIELRGVLYLYNTQEGKKIQVGSGKTVTHFFGDEVAKSSFRAVYNAIEPALLSDTGKLRCVPLFTFTGGEAEKAEDAKNLILYPDEKKQFISQVDNRVVGARVLFGQYRKDCKIPMKFSDYVGQKTNTWLDDYPILATDFDLANKVIDEELATAAKNPDPSILLSKKIFFPRKLEDMFLMESNNNFPVEACMAHQEWLKINSEPDYIDFFRDENLNLQWRNSNLKPISSFPVNHDANKESPVVIYEHPELGVPHGTYCIGVDCYNKNESSDRVNSLGTIYVLKRMVDPLGDSQYEFVASYAGRPDDISKFYNIAYNLTEYYNGIILPELNERFSDFFVNKKKGYIIQNAMQLARDISQSGFIAGSEKGLSPTTRNQRYGMELLVNYAIEEIVDRKGNPMLGVKRIPDPMLLEEMIHYRAKSAASKGVHDGNFDRIIAAYHAIILAEHLDKYMPIPYTRRLEKEEKKKRDIVIKGFFGDLSIKPKNKPSKPKGMNFI